MTVSVVASATPIKVVATGDGVAVTAAATKIATSLTAGQGPQGATGPAGPAGATGQQGGRGESGDPGPANTLSIGTVTSGATAAATITGTSPAQTLNLTLPTGPPGTTTWAGITDKPTEFPSEAHGHTASEVSGLAAVATSGAYADLTGSPSLATVATSGAYADLSGTPSLATVATSGAYGDLSGTPTLATVATTGSYADLTGTPSSMAPTAHAASHKTGGSDALSASDIGAAAASHNHTLSAITDAGTAASKSVPSTGNASATEVVLGSDTRLTDSRNPTSHTHGASDIASGTIASARLPAATTTTSGAVIVGSGINVSSGTISATATSVGAAATSHAHGNLDANGLISGNTNSDYIVVTQAGGSLGLASSLNQSQVYVADLGLTNIATDELLDAVFSSVDSAITTTNDAITTAQSYVPGYDGIADADDWITRVYAAGAGVTTATRAAVTRFCVAITAAGLRSKFTRLNVFCGSSLTAALVPIYRGPSRTGTQYGSTTDTNNNFVSGSYSESSGLTGNASTRYLTLGTFSGLRSNWATGHFGIDYTGADATDRYLMGGFFNESLTSPRGWYRMWGSTTYGINGVFGNPTKSGFTTGGNLKIVNRSSSTSLWFYEAGERVSTETTTSNTSTEQPGGQFCIMAASYTNVSGGVATTSVNGYGPAAGTCRGYTIGDSLTQFEAYAFGQAWKRLQQELGRS